MIFIVTGRNEVVASGALNRYRLIAPIACRVSYDFVVESDLDDRTATFASVMGTNPPWRQNGPHLDDLHQSGLITSDDKYTR